MDRTTKPTLPPQALQAVEAVRDLLGDQVTGAYLFGSAVAGGLRANSDVDVLVVVNRPLPRTSREQLVARLLSISARVDDPASGRPLELTVLNHADLVPWRYPPRVELVYGEWLRDAFEANRIPPPCTDPDLAVLLTQLRDNSVPLLGPAAAELFDPVPPRDLRRALVDSLPALLADVEGDERNVLLTLARMWLTATTGEIAPKDRAAAWARDRLPEPHRWVLDTARKAYLGEITDHWHRGDREVAATMAFMRQAIEAVVGRRSAD